MRAVIWVWAQYFFWMQAKMRYAMQCDIVIDMYLSFSLAELRFCEWIWCLYLIQKPQSVELMNSPYLCVHIRKHLVER